MVGFGTALTALKKGKRLTRKGWNGKGQYLYLFSVNGLFELGMDFIVIHTTNGVRVPWTASQTDILAEDWVVF